MDSSHLKATLKEIILWQQHHIPGIKIIKRDIVLNDNFNFVVTGIRRAGKSYLLYQHILSILEKGYSIEEMLFVNFEDERLRGMKMSELHLVLDAYFELFPHKPIIFLDEIQNVDGWEHFARRLADQGYRVYITGSNSHMLSREVGATLGGRYMTLELWPFSLEEYLKAHNITLGQHWAMTPQRQDVERMLPEYLKYGGFPESFLLPDKRSYISGLYNRVLFNDIVLRYEIRNESNLSLLVRKLADSLMQPVGMKRLADILNSEGTKLSRPTVSTWLNYLSDAYLIFKLDNFTSSLSERANIRKYYFRSNGLLTLFILDNKAKLLENMVAVSLKRRFDEGLWYYKKNIEVDFYLPSAGVGVQACYDTNDAKTLKHECEALLSLHSYYPLKRAIIVTYGTEDTVEYEGLNIEVVPLSVWLLKECHSL